MIGISSLGVSPTFSSTSMPRSWKIFTASGASSSAIRTLGLGAISRRLLLLGFDFAIGPVEPGQQRIDIAGLDRRSAPDPQARRGVAIGTGIEADTLGLDGGREFLRDFLLCRGREVAEPRIGDGQAHAGRRSDRRIFRQERRPAAM